MLAHRLPSERHGVPLPDLPVGMTYAKTDDERLITTEPWKEYLHVIRYLEVVLLDRHTNVIDRKMLPTEEAIAFAADYMRIHGTDPDCDGEGAMAGSIFFYPASDADL